MPTVYTPQTPENDSVPVIQIENLTKQYSGAEVPSLKDFSLTCFAGEIVGLLGHNGAGKSTTLKCITGMLPLSGGCIKLNGYDIATAPVKAKFTFGFVSDKHDVFVKMTGIQYINFMADAYGVSRELRAERLKQYDELFGLGDRLKEPISNYSHGMRQKVCMMGSLMHSPKLWILDEPMIGLDPLTSEKVAKFMKEYAAKGNCILFSSHNVHSVQKICNRAVVIHKGVKTDDFRLSDFNSKILSLEEFFLSRTAENEYEGDDREDYIENECTHANDTTFLANESERTDDTSKTELDSALQSESNSAQGE